MKKLFILFLCIPLVGCQEAAKVSDLSLGMKYEQAVNICTRGMNFVETKQDDNVVITRYRVDFLNDGFGGELIWGSTPYLLTFEEQPGLENKLTHIELYRIATLRTTTSNRQQMQHSNSVSNISSDDSSVLEPDGYGLGVHKNRYGQPVRLEPDFGGVYGERLEIETDGYGMGVHMDQYGRPVREKKWP